MCLLYLCCCVDMFSTCWYCWYALNLFVICWYAFNLFCCITYLLGLLFTLFVCVVRSPSHLCARGWSWAGAPSRWSWRCPASRREPAGSDPNNQPEPEMAAAIWEISPRTMLDASPKEGGFEHRSTWGFEHVKNWEQNTIKPVVTHDPHSLGNSYNTGRPSSCPANSWVGQHLFRRTTASSAVVLYVYRLIIMETLICIYVYIYI